MVPTIALLSYENMFSIPVSQIMYIQLRDGAASPERVAETPHTQCFLHDLPSGSDIIHSCHFTQEPCVHVSWVLSSWLEHAGGSG